MKRLLERVSAAVDLDDEGEIPDGKRAKTSDPFASCTVVVVRPIGQPRTVKWGQKTVEITKVGALVSRGPVHVPVTVSFPKDDKVDPSTMAAILRALGNAKRCFVSEDPDDGSVSGYVDVEGEGHFELISPLAAVPGEVIQMAVSKKFSLRPHVAEIPDDTSTGEEPVDDIVLPSSPDTGSKNATATNLHDELAPATLSRAPAPMTLESKVFTCDGTFCVRVYLEGGYPVLVITMPDGSHAIYRVFSSLHVISMMRNEELTEIMSRHPMFLAEMTTNVDLFGPDGHMNKAAIEKRIREHVPKKVSAKDPTKEKEKEKDYGPSSSLAVSIAPAIPLLRDDFEQRSEANPSALSPISASVMEKGWGNAVCSMGGSADVPPSNVMTITATRKYGNTRIYFHFSFRAAVIAQMMAGAAVSNEVWRNIFAYVHRAGLHLRAGFNHAAVLLYDPVAIENKEPVQCSCTVFGATVEWPLLAATCAVEVSVAAASPPKMTARGPPREGNLPWHSGLGILPPTDGRIFALLPLQEIPALGAMAHISEWAAAHAGRVFNSAADVFASVTVEEYPGVYSVMSRYAPLFFFMCNEPVVYPPKSAVDAFRAAMA